MSKINPDYLLKDELEFEVRLRGEEPVALVNDLRKQLRNLLRSGKAVLEKFKNEKYALQDVEICKFKAEELLAQVGDLGPTPDLNCVPVFRLRLRLEHVLRRLKFWTRSGLLSGDCDLTSVESQLVEGLQGLVDVNLVEREEEGVVLPPAPAETRGEASVTKPADGSSTAPPVGSVPAELPPNASPEGSPAVGTMGVGSQLPTNQAAPNLVSPLNSRGSSVTMPHAGDMYSKLQNPLSNLLKDLPVVDGLDANLLLQFIEILLRAKEFPGMSDSTLLQLCFPHCRSPLLEVLLSCLERGVTLDQFHGSLVENFLPGRLRENLRQERFCRLQRHGEELAHFVNSVKLAAKVLRIPMTEREIVEVIIEGITPEARSRLVFCSRPTSFVELSRICVTAGAVAYNDQSRGVQQPSRNRLPVMQINAPPIGQGMRQMGPRVCFGCGQPGHIRRFCRAQGVSQPSSRSATVPVSNVPKNLLGGEDGK